jgi:glutathione synthase
VRSGPTPAPARKSDTLTAFIDRVKDSPAERIRLDELDAVFLRNDSIEVYRIDHRPPA